MSTGRALTRKIIETFVREQLTDSLFRIFKGGFPEREHDPLFLDASSKFLNMLDVRNIATFWPAMYKDHEFTHCEKCDTIMIFDHRLEDRGRICWVCRKKNKEQANDQR